MSKVGFFAYISHFPPLKKSRQTLFCIFNTIHSLSFLCIILSLLQDGILQLPEPPSKSDKMPFHQPDAPPGPVHGPFQSQVHDYKGGVTERNDGKALDTTHHTQ